MVVEDRPVKWKRRRGRSLGQHPVDEAKRLATLTLVGTFSRESAWLCVPPEVAFLLDRLCLGRKVTSATTCEGVPIIPWVSNTGRARTQTVRLSALETFYLVHAVHCLTLYQEVEEDADDGSAPGAHSAEALALWASDETLSAVRRWRDGTGEVPDTLAGIVGPRRGGGADGGAAAAQQPPTGWGPAGGAAAAAGTSTSTSAGGEAAAAPGPQQAPPRLAQMTLHELWHACVASRRDFAAVYSGYLFCRARGWLIRSGLQYGADFVLYPRHPTLAHSSYSALVLSRLRGPLPADRAPLPGEPAPDRGGGGTVSEWAPNWPELQALSRLCVQVNKGMLLLYVEVAPEAAPLPPVAEGSVEILERVAVTEVEVSRFNPNRHREDWDPGE